MDTNDLPTKVTALSLQVGAPPPILPPPEPSAAVAAAAAVAPPPPHLVPSPIPPRSARHTLHVLGWTLTPSRRDVLTRLATLNTAPPPLSAAAAGMNAAFPGWAATHAGAVGATVNVVFFDFLTAADVAAVTAAAHLGGRVAAVEVGRVGGEVREGG